MKYRRIIGWCALLPRILLMTSASISLYHAYAVGSIWGIIAGMILTILWGLDVLYLTVVLIHDLIKRNDEWCKKVDNDTDEMVECEKELFDTTEEK